MLIIRELVGSLYLFFCVEWGVFFKKRYKLNIDMMGEKTECKEEGEDREERGRRRHSGKKREKVEGEDEGNKIIMMMLMHHHYYLL